MPGSERHRVPSWLRAAGGTLPLLLGTTAVEVTLLFPPSATSFP